MATEDVQISVVGWPVQDDAAVLDELQAYPDGRAEVGAVLVQAVLSNGDAVDVSSSPDASVEMLPQGVSRIDREGGDLKISKIASGVAHPGVQLYGGFYGFQTASPWVLAASNDLLSVAARAGTVPR